MKTVLKVIGGLIVVVVVGVGAMAAMQPDVSHVERSVVIAAAPADVFPFANDFDLWMKWNPWSAMDPNEVVTFSESKVGEGAWYEWKGEKVGAGKMTITSSVPNEKVTEDLVFTEPFASKAAVAFTFAPEGEGTKVTWSYDAENNAMSKVAGVFMDMDTMLGGDFDRGLASLKPLAEEAAAKRKEAEAAAEAAAAAAATAAAEGTEGAPATTATP